MNLRSLTQKLLWQNTTELIVKERALGLELLHHLAEIQRRRLFSDHGFNSLWDMLVRGHGYSDGSAHRRVNAIRLLDMREDLEEKIASGAINLTNAAALYLAFKKNELSREQQDELIQNVANKSTREAQREIAKVVPRELPRDRETPLDGEHTLYTCVVDNEVHEMLQKLKAEFSHIDPGMSKNDILKRVLKTHFAQSKSPPAQRRAVLERDGHQCTEPGCGSDHQLEIDHIVPLHFGGTNELSNLRVLCREHNLMHARRWYGRQKMQQYMRH